ncbi:rhodanese-like domain-containing protein [Jeotgalibacillus malaysiensis]|uniref:rhodanese-like domain-containing protein n=1 Tax=Jeotgalibacillus malaysiensis TaxID=1508404 RepID=UPI003851497E
MKSIMPTEVEQKLNGNEELHILDVREAEEVKGGKIPGAMNIPLGLLEFRKQELDKSREYIVVCASGGRSTMGTQYLEGQGYNVTNMSGGMMNWQGKTE